MVLSRLGDLQAYGYERIYHAKRQMLAHRLVWETLFGPIPEGLTINHKNGIRDDNRPCNLELATASEQILHTYRVLQSRQPPDWNGEKHPNAKLTWDQVAALRKPGPRGYVRTLARQFGITYGHAYKVARGDLWRKR